MSNHGEQLPLGIGLRDSATFDNYWAGRNAAAIFALRNLAEPVVFLWGSSGTGKTHLLQALCHELGAGERVPVYLPLSEAVNGAPEWLDGLEEQGLIALDGVQAIVGDRAWETALFNLFNRARDAGTPLRVVADAAPPALGLLLPDLATRLAWGPVYQLHPLSDEDKVAALQLRARRRGMSMPDEVASWLLRNYRRDTHALFALLDQLDRETLAAQRRLTVPFVRGLLLD